MLNYDFKNLSPIDFEILIQELLQKELNIRLEGFKPGKDGGIDLRYCGNRNLTIQCKHYANSSFRLLFGKLKKEELFKVKRLKPKRYIIATSLGLTPKQKKDLHLLFNPYIKSESDIFGKEDINNLLTKYPEIEKQNIKLWLSSANILECIIHSKIINISNDALDKIKQDVKYYVWNKSYSEAMGKLDKHNFCIIAGIPGIGKTLLAEMIIFHFVSNGYELIKINSDIAEANEIVEDVTRKRIYYYDDFLGQTSITEKFNKNEDQALLDFINSIKQSKHSKLLLTTREYILNQAKDYYERFDRDINKFDIYVIDLSKYSRINKAKILFNHIYFSDLPQRYKERIVKNHNYLRIIDHKNYNPRIIDQMTKSMFVGGISDKEYVSHILSNLSNPLIIWKHPFEKQISHAARGLLIVLISMPSEVFLKDLEKAFNKYYSGFISKYKISGNPQDFNKALKELDGNFIRSEKIGEKILIAFHNPSIIDFINNYLQNNPQEVNLLLENVVFYDQILWFWRFYQSQDEKIKEISFVETLAMFYSVMTSAIDMVDCRVISYRTENAIKKEHWQVRLEDRIEFFIDVSCKTKNTNLLSQIPSLLILVIKGIDNGEVSGSDMSELLCKLIDNKMFIEETNAVVEKVKDDLMKSCKGMEDFRAIKELGRMVESFVTEDEIATLQSKFRSFVRKYFEVNKNENPEYIRNDGCIAAEVAEFLEMENPEKDFEDLANKKEASIDEAADQYDEFKDRSENEKDDNLEIQSLFETL